MNNTPYQTVPAKTGLQKLFYNLSDLTPLLGSCNLHSKEKDFSWDMHYNLEFGLGYSGCQRYVFPGKFTVDVGPGQVWFCGMWEPHGHKTLITPSEVMVIKILPQFLAQMQFPEAPDFHPLSPFIASPRLRPQASGKMKKDMIFYAERLKDLLSANTPHLALKLRLMLMEILLKLYEACPRSDCWNRKKPAIEFTPINRAIELVFNSASFVSTDKAAKECGMSRRAFSALFYSWMNMRFNNFAAKHRLQQAVAQLRNTQEPVKTIALRWGFADASHFHRVFMKHFGLSPLAYRHRK